ncbi:MAG: S26 family signal peptidase [Thermoplasmatota archaeon]
MALGSGARDTLLAIAVVAGILGVLYLYTGVWPPMVVVESGSMMHPADQVPYGRVGTINPGDLVLVKSVGSPSDVALWAQEGGSNYGEPGDVLVYYPSGDHGYVPVIHRAITWVEVNDSARGRTYSFAWPADYAWNGPIPTECVNGTCTFGPTGIYFPPLGFQEPYFRPGAGWTPPSSGWVTKGDNQATNPAADQANGISCPVPGASPRPSTTCSAVDPTWVEGVARGQLPWFGLIKLALGGHYNVAQPPPDGWVTVLWASAPPDLWVCLALSLAILIAIPVVIDLVRSARRGGGAKPLAEGDAPSAGRGPAASAPSHGPAPGGGGSRPPGGRP